MKLVLLWLSLVAVAGSAEARHYDFDTSDFRVNSTACLEDFRPHGAAAQWACVRGVLQGLSVDAGMKRTAAARDVVLTFAIVRVLPRAPDGRGETAIWLRNGLENGVMRRVRLVIEEGAGGGASVRLEESFAGGYRRLATRQVASYTGVYEVSLVDDWFDLTSQGQYVSAATSVLNPGGIYFFSSGNEGGATGYDDLIIEEL